MTETDMWPVSPNPEATNLVETQFWSFHDGVPSDVLVGGVRLPATSPRLGFLGVRHDAAGQAYPGAFAYSSHSGEPLRELMTGPDPFGYPFGSLRAEPVQKRPHALHVDKAGARAFPLTPGLPSLFAAGRPSALYLFQENLGSLEWHDPAAGEWMPLGRLPPADLPPGAHALAAGRDGLAYATADGLHVVPLPQLGPDLVCAQRVMPGGRCLSAPAWIGDAILLPVERDGRLLLCRQLMAGADFAAELEFRDLGEAAGAFAAPVANRVDDLVFAGEAAFVATRGTSGDAVRIPWPEGFVPILSQRTYRDRNDYLYQLGAFEDGYAYVRLSPVPVVHRLSGPHLSAGGHTYFADERYAVPWLAPVEPLRLGTAYGGSVIVPLLALERDTILMAVPPHGKVGDFVRGQSMLAQSTGYLLHHAHETGLIDLNLSLSVTSVFDAAAVLSNENLYVYSRSEGRCHILPVAFR